MGIRATVTASPGADRDDLAWVEVEHYLRKRYVESEEDVHRRKAARTRCRLYDSGGIDQIFALIDEVFKDPEVRRLRKEVAPFARFDNALRRVVNERARVYAKPPRAREVDNGTDGNYQEVQRLTNHNAAMRRANVLTTLSNDSYWLFRVREMPDGSRAPRTDIIGPDNFIAIADPRDRTKLAAVAIDQTPDIPEPKESDAHWLVWTDGESFKLDKRGRIMRDTVMANPFGRMPGLLVSSDYRATSLLDPLTGEDIVSAHLAAWLANTSLLKEMKSLSKQAAFVGETGRSPTGQAQDSERDLMLAEGVGVFNVDRGVDLDKYQRAADHIVERAAANYGVPPSVLRHSGATSGYEIDLRRIPLEELREDQIAVFREAEREFARVQAAVLAVDLPSLAFDPDPWFIDFAEIKRPVSELEKWQVRDVKRKMGHSDPISEMLEDNPDLTEDMAKERVSMHLAANLAFIEVARVRPNVPEDANAENPGMSPQDNGADNAPRDDDENADG